MLASGAWTLNNLHCSGGWQLYSVSTLFLRVGKLPLCFILYPDLFCICCEGCVGSDCLEVQTYSPWFYNQMECSITRFLLQFCLSCCLRTDVLWPLGRKLWDHQGIFFLQCWRGCPETSKGNEGIGWVFYASALVSWIFSAHCSRILIFLL